MKMLDLANAVGLLCGGIGLIAAANEIKNYYVSIAGWLATIFFSLLCIATFYRWIEEVIKLRNEQLSERKYKQSLFISLPMPE